MRKRISTILLVICMFACDNKFHGFKAVNRPEVVREGFLLSQSVCESQYTTPRYIPIEGARTDGTNISISGPLCETLPEVAQVQPPHISFLVDYSGSMETVDPWGNNGCARFQAARSFYDRMKVRFGHHMNKVTFSLVSFGDGADDIGKRIFQDSGQVSNLPVGIISSNFFEENLLKENLFCQFADEATNYEAGLLAVEDIVSELEADRKNSLFMVTDGIPTLDQKGHVCDPVFYDPVCEKSAATAAKFLRSQSSMVNVLFLLSGEDAIDEHTHDWLKREIAGDDGLVRFARDAGDAVNHVEDFQQQPAPLDASISGTGSVEGNGWYQEAQVSFERTPENGWQFNAEFFMPADIGVYELEVKPTVTDDDDLAPTIVEIVVTE